MAHDEKIPPIFKPPTFRAVPRRKAHRVPDFPEEPFKFVRAVPSEEPEMPKSDFKPVRAEESHPDPDVFPPEQQTVVPWRVGRKLFARPMFADGKLREIIKVMDKIPMPQQDIEYFLFMDRCGICTMEEITLIDETHKKYNVEALYWQKKSN